ncbi:hypothetical protein P167DRAFT_533268 [Morchella conica CCBAS932]|uniref:Uncharacterized protein n=1 Tax=Morchella conica CCBAS932 TaxID=1392247 RepID=A0A3N4LBV0_9PEZI|nr:hypothetical protein P167DRAFT_533268 [Morchella conica CCBAS932]
MSFACYSSPIGCWKRPRSEIATKVMVRPFLDVDTGAVRVLTVDCEGGVCYLVFLTPFGYPRIHTRYSLLPSLDEYCLLTNRDSKYGKKRDLRSF